MCIYCKQTDYRIRFVILKIRNYGIQKNRLRVKDVSLIICTRIVYYMD